MLIDFRNLATPRIEQPWQGRVLLQGEEGCQGLVVMPTTLNLGGGVFEIVPPEPNEGLAEMQWDYTFRPTAQAAPTILISLFAWQRFRFCTRWVWEIRWEMNQQLSKNWYYRGRLNGLTTQPSRYLRDEVL
jgi:hypothetical protein